MPCSSNLPLARRIGAVLLGLGLSALLFRAQLASGLVTRGDDMLAGGELERARVYYRRALVFDPLSPTATERLTFAGLLTRTHEALAECVAVATRALARGPIAEALRVDRALCRNALGEYRAAASDFAALAAAGDARYRKLERLELGRSRGSR